MILDDWLVILPCIHTWLSRRAAPKKMGCSKPGNWCALMIFAIEWGRDLIPENAQVIDRQSALLAKGQMIDDQLQFLAGQGSIDVCRTLFRGRMRLHEVGWRNLCRLAEDFGSQCQECGIAVHSGFDPPPARSTVVQMIGHRQQLSAAQLLPAETFYLILGQVLYQSLFNPQAARTSAVFLNW
jgi:hypothetical protein